MPLYEDIYQEQFSFGKNWKDFLDTLDDEKILYAKKHLLDFLGGEDAIRGKKVIDFGSGSGLMSLCFVLLGAEVTSIDIDESSLECTRFLREKYEIPEEIWKIEKGSVLDIDYMASLGTFDVVYSWGVIHHSGDMWKGLENIIHLCHEDAKLYIALYNSNTRILEGTSSFWEKAKSIYAKHRPLRPLMKMLYTSYLILGLTISGKNPFSYIRDYRKNTLRGMDFFVDIEDWLGGYPYEHASYKAIQDYYEAKGFSLEKGIEVRSIGCNEFLFIRD